MSKNLIDLGSLYNITSDVGLEECATDGGWTSGEIKLSYDFNVILTEVIGSDSIQPINSAFYYADGTFGKYVSNNILSDTNLIDIRVSTTPNGSPSVQFNPQSPYPSIRITNDVLLSKDTSITLTFELINDLYSFMGNNSYTVTKKILLIA